jgi:hypothetical protein
MKLWNVTVVVEVDVMVVAEDRAAAEKIAAGRQARDEALRDALDDAYASGTREVTTAQGIAEAWDDALPFGPRGVEELTCAQWMERLAPKVTP